MRYIRTKDYGVCKVMSEDKNTLSYENGCVIGCLWKDSYKDQIQYADTIEELCDEFVLYDSKDMINTFISTYERVMNWKEVLDKRKLDKSNYEIYGAIWTDKGLIYVAKMNDKGELELI